MLRSLQILDLGIWEFSSLVLVPVQGDDENLRREVGASRPVAASVLATVLSIFSLTLCLNVAASILTSVIQSLYPQLCILSLTLYLNVAACISLAATPLYCPLYPHSVSSACLSIFLYVSLCIPCVLAAAP